mgnify:CR=1 FL=1
MTHTKILLGAIALGLFLNASNVFIDKAYARDKVQRVQICDDYNHCAKIDRTYGGLVTLSIGVE